MKWIIFLCVFITGANFVFAQQPPPDDRPVAGETNEIILLRKTPHEETRIFTGRDERPLLEKNDTLLLSPENRKDVSGEKNEHIPVEKGKPRKEDE